MTRNRRGIGIISVLISVLIIISATVFFAQGSVSARKQSKLLHDQSLATAFATELMEFLRSHTDDRLREYLGINPFTRNGTCPTCLPYKLCSHINLLDRNAGVLLNEDPIAALPSSVLDGPNSKLAPNRWYQVQVVDLARNIGGGLGDMNIRKDLCGISAKDIKFKGGTGGALELKTSEKFLVTVGVSWIPKNGSVADVERVVLTSILPDKHL